MAASSASSATVADPRLLIELTNEESKVFNNILSAVTVLKLDCQVRVAGGWVRDKLLKVHAPKDIDLVLDTMNGYDFAEAINDYLCTHNHNGTKEAHRIKANPAKSKHPGDVYDRRGRHRCHPLPQRSIHNGLADSCH